MTAWLGSDNDLHVAVQRVQEADQPLDRKTVEFACQKLGYLRLTGTKDFGSPLLSQMAMSDYACDLIRERSLGQELIGLG